MTEQEKERMKEFEEFLEKELKTPVAKLYKDERGKYRDPVTLMQFQAFSKGASLIK